MANILLIETATDTCSVAISAAERIVAMVETPQTTQHAAVLTRHIEACCREAGLSLSDMDAVALSAGPGAYTSLRVGASVAKGICYALDKPLMAVNTLHALAHALRGQGFEALVPMLDARRQEVWLAAFDADMREIAPAQPLILENNSFDNFVRQYFGDILPERLALLGNGVKKNTSGVYSEKAVVVGPENCSAAWMLLPANEKFKNADFQDIAYYEPFYMKPPNITVQAKNLI